nr:thiamine phosphate synthase [Methanomethylovorans sp.]
MAAKKEMLKEIDFYLVTDSGLSMQGTLSDVRDAVASGCRIVQYREKNKSTKEMVAEALQIKAVCGDEALFLV